VGEVCSDDYSTVVGKTIAQSSLHDKKAKQVVSFRIVADATRQMVRIPLDLRLWSTPDTSCGDDWQSSAQVVLVDVVCWYPEVPDVA
jgi:hypothetical protein